jgi:chromosomal replication initiation ATPase DnaA
MSFQYCEEDGDVFVYEDEETVREKRKLRYEYFLKNSGIPSFYHTINFEDYKGDKNNKEFLYIKHYADNCHTKEFAHVHLFIYGVHSTQKSALMYNVCKEAIKNGMKVKCILAGTLIDKLMKLQGFNYIEEIYNEIQELKKCDLIAVDDFGDGNKTLAWKGESKNLIIGAWDTFLREILASNTKIVMTSNYDLNFIKEYYGTSVFELLDRNFFPVHLTESVKEVRKYNVKDIFNTFDKNYDNNNVVRRK